jgi:hypothetical protein
MVDIKSIPLWKLAVVPKINHITADRLIKIANIHITLIKSRNNITPFLYLLELYKDC